MRTLKYKIRIYMYQITCILVTAILIIILYLQLLNEQRWAYENATVIFSHLEQVLAENEQELSEIQEEYRQTCLHNAETIARLIEGNPELLTDIEELKKIARSVEVDEIHIFDSTGRIYSGTHPEHYNNTFYSDEQMMFFLPLLEDKTLKLVQDITPTTTTGVLMQYSALWSNNQEFIVQVGMAPVNIMKVTEKHELSHLFSLFRVSAEATYYAINVENGEIIGSSDLKYVGKNFSEIGLNLSDIKENSSGFHTIIEGKHSFCVFKKIGSNYIGQVILSRSLYQRIPSTMLSIIICLTVVILILINTVIGYLNKYVVNKIDDINEKLKSIAVGNLDEIVDVQSSIEFAELSNYINIMVKSLLENNRKMSYVLSKTNTHIGTYEFNPNMKKVRFTEYIPKIFSLTLEEMEILSSDTYQFQAFLDTLRKYPLPDEPGIYQVKDQYIRLEEIRNQGDIFGVAIDVTTEIMKRREIETERDLDSLTGLYNRRGLDIKLARLFSNPDLLGHSAIIMIDADGLKQINDTYGHDKGDIYIKKIAQLIHNFGVKNSIASRQGGDEFVLFLYHYETEKELLETIETLKYVQNHHSAHLDENLNVPLRFSLGYCLTKECTDYQKLLKQADEKMYKNKLERKHQINTQPNVLS